MRLDSYLAQYFPEYSRSAWQKYIKAGRVKVNGEVIKSNKHILGEDDEVTVDPYEVASEDMSLPVIFENDEVIVLDKPVGVLSHAKGGIVPENTVADFIAQKSNFAEARNRHGIVHRLDRATSGVMIGGKTPEATSFLQKQFSLKKVKKVYVAVVKGIPEPKKAKLDLPIERNPAQPSQFRVGPNGKPATTIYEVVSSKNDKSLIKLMPETGRTHQLRVHMAHVGHPIVGDKVYGNGRGDRMYLHATSLEITIPGGERKVFKSETPKVFKKELENE